MGNWRRISAALEALPEARKEEIAAILETVFFGDLHPQATLSEAQIAELKARLENPGPLASESEVDAFFARFGA